MTRFFLIALFILMLVADPLGLRASLAPGLSLKNAFLYLIFVSIAIDTALRRNRDLELLSVTVPYALLIFYAVFGWVVVVALSIYPGFEGMRSFMLLKSQMADNLIVLIVYFYGIMNARDAAWLLRVMVWAVIGVNLLSIIDSLNIPDLGYIGLNHRGRLGGPFGEPNQFAAFLSMFLLAIIGLAVIERGWRRLLAVFGILITLLALLMTASRGGLVGVIGGAMLATVILRKFITVKAAVSALAGTVALIVFAIPVLYLAGLGDIVGERLIGLAATGNAYEMSSGRTFIWGMALGKMFENPVTLLIGFGWDTYRQFRDFSLATHNIYLLIFFELGLIGLLLILFVYTNVVRTARRALQSADEHAATTLFVFIFGFCGVMVSAFFVELYSPWILIWAYVGVMMRLAIATAESQSSAANTSVAASVSRGRVVEQS